MTTFRVAICDDDNLICSQIEAAILKYAKLSTISINVEVFLSGKELLKVMNTGDSFDLIYLDIEMEGINGLDVGYTIRKMLLDYSTEIIYISGKNEYDRQLFDFQPIHFIPKPISDKIVIEDLVLAMQKTQKLSGKFTYKKSGELLKVSINNILYFESYRKEIKIITTYGEDIFYSTITNVLDQVQQYNFLNIHRSYVVNYSHIAIFKYDSVTMSNQDILPISQGNRADVRKFQLKMEEAL